MRDSLKFPDLIHEMKRHPRISLRSAENQLGFLDITAGSLGLE
jgi:catalase